MATDDELYYDLPALVESSDEEGIMGDGIETELSSGNGTAPNIDTMLVNLCQTPKPEAKKTRRVRISDPIGHKAYCRDAPNGSERTWCYPVEYNSFPDLDFKSLHIPDSSHSKSRRWVDGEVDLPKGDGQYTKTGQPIYNHRNRIRKLNNPRGWAIERRRGVMVAKSLRNVVLNELLIEGDPSHMSANLASNDVWQKQLRSMDYKDGRQREMSPDDLTFQHLWVVDSGCSLDLMGREDVKSLMENDPKTMKKVFFHEHC